MTAHQQRLAPSVLLDRPDAPAALVAICRRMMEKSPVNRFQTATEVQQALGAWLESEAAFGRVGRASVLVQRDAASGRSSRSAGKSHAELVSGSAPDLAPDAHEPFAGLTDTDPNLVRATVRMPGQPGKAAGDSSRALRSNSEVLPGVIAAAPSSDSVSHPTSPEPPPVACPPVVPPASAAGSAWVLDNRPSPSLDLAPTDMISVPATVSPWTRRKRMAAPAWPWIGLLSALIVVALLLALLAL